MSTTRGLLAVQSAVPRVAGVAVIHFDDYDAWMDLKVVRPARRVGVGSELLSAAVELAASERATRLIVVSDTEAEPSAEPFLLARGFTANARFTTYESDFCTSLPVLQGTRDRLVAAHRVPASVVTTTLPNAPEVEVAQLYAEYIGNRRDLAHAPLRLDHDLTRWRLSPVVMVNGKVQAAALLEVVGDVAIIPGRMVAREYQGTWANAVLMGAAADLLLNTPTRRLRFTAPPGNRDTLKLARRFNARVVSAQTRFERTL